VPALYCWPAYDLALPAFVSSVAHAVTQSRHGPAALAGASSARDSVWAFSFSDGPSRRICRVWTSGGAGAIGISAASPLQDGATRRPALPKRSNSISCGSCGSSVLVSDPRVRKAIACSRESSGALSISATLQSDRLGDMTLSHGSCSAMAFFRARCARGTKRAYRTRLRRISCTPRTE
jgi:hypothetical protein